MKRKMLQLSAFVSLFAAVPVSAHAAHLMLENGLLMGARRVEVNGQFFDAEFRGGSCADVFSGCDGVVFPFVGAVDARNASQALLDQVLLGTYDTNPATTNGCAGLGGTECKIVTPYFAGGGTMSAQAALNDVADANDRTIPFPGSSTGTAADVTFAKWSPSANNVLITPNSDPGGLVAGDSLTFTVSVDSVTPPAGNVWSELSVRGVRVANVTASDLFNFSGACTDLLGREVVFIFGCDPDTNGLHWSWLDLSASNQAVTGNLFEFTALFDKPGTYQVFIASADAGFSPSGPVTLAVPNNESNPIVITVASNAAGLLAQLLADVTDLEPGKSLRNKILLAQTYLAANDIPATCAVLNDFIKQVRAQLGKKKISTTAGDKLLTDATAIRTALGCSD